jgi:hypothetical protein
MAKYIITAPDGKDYEVEGEGTQEEALAEFQAAWKPTPSRAPAAPQKSGAEQVAEEMPWYQKALVGAGGTLRDQYLGAKGLVTDLSPEEAAEREEWKANKEPLGGWGTAGQVGAELALTAAPAMKGAQLVGRAASALPKAAALASKGGRVANLGTAGRAATEGAIAGGMLAPEAGESQLSRVGGAAGGAALGAALPLALAPAAKAKDWVAREFARKGPRVQERVYNNLERTLGKDALDRAVGDVQGGLGSSSLPLSTAGTSRNLELAQLERGARSRGSAAEWGELDKSVADEAWDELQNALSRSTEVGPARAQRVSEIMAAGKAQMDALPLSEKNRNALGKQIASLKGEQEVIANPEVRKVIDEALMTVADPNATLGALPQLYWRLGQEAGQSSAVQSAREAIKTMADQRSKGFFSKMMDDYGRQMDKVKQSESATGILREFSTDQGVPVTAKTFGETPVIESKVLRRALAKHGEAPGKGSTMRPADRDRVEEMAEELRRHELYKNAPGATGVDETKLESILASGRNNPIYMVPGLRGLARMATEPVEHATKRTLDSALRDPMEFMKMVQAKQARNAPLSDKERFLVQLLRSQGQLAGQATSGD